MLSLTACGSSGSGGGYASKRGEAAKSARQIVADAAAAVRAAHGYHIQASMVQSGRRASVVFTVTSPTNFEFSAVSGPARADIIEADGGTYLRANAAFLAMQGGPASFAGHWLKVRAADIASVTNIPAQWLPATEARCLGENLGTLRVAGTATVAGTRVVVVKTAGNAPGSRAGEMDVAASGRPYPLRMIATGPKKPGGKVDVCNDGKGDAGVVKRMTLSGFGSTPPVKPPTGARSIG